MSIWRKSRTGNANRPKEVTPRQQKEVTSRSEEDPPQIGPWRMIMTNRETGEETDVTPVAEFFCAIMRAKDEEAERKRKGDRRRRENRGE